MARTSSPLGTPSLQCWFSTGVSSPDTGEAKNDRAQCYSQNPKDEMIYFSEDRAGVGVGLNVDLLE